MNTTPLLRPRIGAPMRLAIAASSGSSASGARPWPTASAMALEWRSRRLQGGDAHHHLHRYAQVQAHAHTHTHAHTHFHVHRMARHLPPQPALQPESRATVHPDPQPELRLLSFHAWRSRAIVARLSASGSRGTSPMEVRLLTSPGSSAPSSSPGGPTASSRLGAVAAQPVAIWSGARDAANGVGATVVIDAGARLRHAFPTARALAPDDGRSGVPPRAVDGRSSAPRRGSTRSRPSDVASNGHQAPASTARTALSVPLVWQAPDAGSPGARLPRPIGGKRAMTARGGFGLAGQPHGAGAIPGSRSSAARAELTWRAPRRNGTSADDSPASDRWAGEGREAAATALRTTPPRVSSNGVSGVSGAPTPSAAAPALPPQGSAAASAMADRLAQDVMQRLERHLRIERERRGL